jgi:Skp family chaperone for outer membrane proteins
MSNVGDAFKKAGTNVALGVADTVGAAGKIASSVSNTAVGLTSSLGDAATSGAKIVSSTVGTIATTTQRMENSTREMASRRAEIERGKTASQKGKTETEIAQIEANTKTKLLEIQNKYDKEQARLKLEQEQELDKLNTQQTQQLLNQKDNTNKQQKAYYYGFTKSNPGPNDTGYKKSNMPFSKWCYSYIPQYFVANDGSFIDIDFSETLPTGQRSQYISAINKQTGQKITIGFETQSITNMFKQVVFVQMPVINYNDENGINKKVNGKMYYTLIWFLCTNKNIGGKKRRSKPNRKTNKRRTNMRTNKRLKTYKRRR